MGLTQRKVMRKHARICANMQLVCALICGLNHGMNNVRKERLQELKRIIKCFFFLNDVSVTVFAVFILMVSSLPKIFRHKIYNRFLAGYSLYNVNKFDF